MCTPCKISIDVMGKTRNGGRGCHNRILLEVYKWVGSCYAALSGLGSGKLNLYKIYLEKFLYHIRLPTLFFNVIQRAHLSAILGYAMHPH